MPTGCSECETLRLRLASRDRQLASIHKITAALSAMMKISDVVREALHVCLECVGARDGSVILYDPRKQKLVFAYVIGEKAAELTGREMEPDQGIAGAVFRTGRLRVSEDVSKEADHDRRVDEELHYRTRNMITVPLKTPQGKTIGVLQVLNKETGQFTDDDIEVLEILGGQIAIAIEAARLYEEARVAEVVRFIGNLSHDVKNMITPAQSGAETLQIIADDMFAQLEKLLTPERCPEAPLGEIWSALQEFREAYPEIITLIQESMGVVQERMAEISAAIKGIISKPHFQRQSLAPVIERVIHALGLVGEKAGVRVSYEPHGALPPLDIDEKQMYNAIYNLVNNAIQATPPGGSVVVRTRLSQPGEFPEFPDEPVAVLEVVDTGEGMPPEVKARVFTDDAISTKPTGTGLGTKIVKNVMDAHRGKIYVESEIGKGTTIRCLIPLSQVAEEA